MNHPADALKEIMFYSVAHLCFGGVVMKAKLTYINIKIQTCG